MYQEHPELSAAQQTKAILADVGSLIQLPQNEDPSMASIKDAAAAKQGQPFLVNAENGDVLIVYQKAAEAILYRPSTKKLVNVGPVNAANNAPAVQQQTSASSATTSTNDATSTKSKK